MVNATAATLVASGPTILLSILTSNPEPYPNAMTIDFHNVATAAGLAASNLVFSISFSPQGGHISHQFDAAMFPAGLVVKCSSALETIIETD
tara:strand:+ start:1086 stop:1361 length:276 start_codon:yes stop_codon:yes gene_type:complete